MANNYSNDNKIHAVQGLEELIEIAILSCSYYFVWTIYRNNVNTGLLLFRGKFLLILLYAILTLVIFKLCDNERYGSLKCFDTCVSQCIAIVIVNVITYFQLCLVMNGMLSVIPMAALTGIDWLIAIFLTCLWTVIYRKIYIPRDMIIVYGNDESMSQVEKSLDGGDKYRITAYMPATVNPDDIIKEVSRHGSVLMLGVPIDIRNQVMKVCYAKNIRTYISPRISDVIIEGTENITLFDTPMRLMNEQKMSVGQRAIKRAADVTLGIAALIPCSIIMLIIAIAIKTEDGGRVFYKQKRLTVGDREFEMLKFRSMIEDAEAKTGAVLASEGDPRITKVGRFLRKHRLDELPQIINIISGDMSIVGPRPERKELADQIIRELPEFSYRTKVKSGLTGYAQVYGRYNTTPYDKLRMDLIYIEHFSLLLDIKLILMTPQMLLRDDKAEGVRSQEK